MKFHLFIIVFLVNTIYAVVYRPVVLMHGILATADDMYELAGWLNASFPGIYIVSIEIGNGHDDSFLLPMNKQVELFCTTILNDKRLDDGFNMLGISQGSLIVRAAVERCSLPVYNLITMVGIHQGIFGDSLYKFLPAQFWELISKYAYEEFVQNLISVAGYWRDPFHLDEYLNRSHFLPDINNERNVRNETYRMNMLRLNAFVMVYSDIDEILTPPQSGWFLGYAFNSLVPETWNQSRQFIEDVTSFLLSFFITNAFSFESRYHKKNRAQETHIYHYVIESSLKKTFFMAEGISSAITLPPPAKNTMLI